MFCWQLSAWCGYLQDAAANFVAVLGDADLSVMEKRCAADALVAVRSEIVAEKIALARLHRQHNDKEAATTAIQEALAIDPVSEQDWQEVDALEKVGKDDSMARAVALAKFGQHEAALSIVTEQLKASDGVAQGVIAIPPELEYLTGGKVPYWRTLRRNMGPWAEPVLEILGLLILLVVVVVLYRRYVKDIPILQIKQFDKGVFEGDHISSHFANSLYSHIEKLQTQGALAGLPLVTGVSEPSDIPQQVKTVMPAASAGWKSPVAWVEAIAALLLWMSPRQVVEVTGSLHNSSKRGIGVTIAWLRTIKY